MLHCLDNVFLSAKLKLRHFVEQFKNDESGVSNFVATVLLILMVVIIGGVVWGFISGFFSELLGKIKLPTMSPDDITY